MARRNAGSKASIANGRYSAASTSSVTLLIEAISTSPFRSTASTVPNSTCIKSAWLPRAATTMIPNESETR